MLYRLQQPELQLLRNRKCGHDQRGLLLRRYLELCQYVSPETKFPRLGHLQGLKTCPGSVHLGGTRQS